MKNKQPLQYVVVLCCCAAVLMGAFAENAYGYIVATTDSGAEIKWPVPSAGFFINTTGGPAGGLSAITFAMQTWTDVTTSDFSFLYRGPTSSTAYGVNDGTNMICFGTLGAGYESTIALNTFWASVSQGTLVDSDIKFNTIFSFNTDGSPDAYDVQTIALHELGHSLSLDDLYDASDSTNVMYGYGTPGEVRRVLAQDDKDGITYLYPIGGGTTTTTAGGGSTTTTTAGGGSTTTTIASGGGGGTSTVSMPVTSSTRTTIISDPDSYGLCPGGVALGRYNPDLENLRAFRDTTLAQSAAGRRITHIYYAYAGSINAALERSPALRAAARKFFETAALLVGTRQEQSSEKR